MSDSARPANRWIPTRHISTLVVGGLGVGTFIIHLAHLLAELDEIVALAVGVVPPMALSLALVGGSYWLWQRDLDEAYHLRILAWVGGGIVGVGGIGISVILYQAAHGTPQTDVVYMSGNWVVTGALGGFLVGVYDARRRAALDALEANRDALAAREQELEQENERLDQFASIVSHDLRNPLNVAQGRLELAEEVCDTAHHESIETALERMEAITEDALKIAREGETVTEADREPVSLARCAESCWELVATGDAELQVEDDRTVSADRGRLRDIVENLYRNAVEHGGEDVTITLGAVDDGLYVEDDGPGIPEHRRDDVFEAGYSTTEDGTGFGLSIIKQIVEAHGWDVHVTESSDGGARFEITGVEFTSE